MLASACILIVDDDPTLCEALTAALIPSYQVLTLATGLGTLEVDYLKKPIRPGDLLARVEHLLALGWRARRPISQQAGRAKAMWSSEAAALDTGVQRAISFIEGQLHTNLRLDRVAREGGIGRFWPAGGSRGQSICCEIGNAP